MQGKMSSGRYTPLQSVWPTDELEPIRSIEEPRDEAYDNKPGICLVINNMTFDEALELKNMPQQEKDEDQLNLVFTSLDFDVVIRQNLTASEMMETAKEYSKKQHEGVFILYILSHGGKDDVVYGTDGGEVTVSALEELFFPSSCRSLTGIPKIFFIDACRGSKVETEYEIPENRKAGRDSDTSSYNPIRKVLLNDDFATIYASSPGMVAHIGNNGSEFTQNLHREIAEAKEKDDFEVIMRRVAKSCDSQVVHRSLRLRKPYFIKCNTKFSKVQNNCRMIQEAMREWLTIRNLTIEILEKLIKKLIEHRRKVNIARLTGGSVAVGGGILAIVGFALTPVTFGVSLGLGIAGVGIGALGGATATGAGIADTFIQKAGVQEAKEHYERDQRQLQIAIDLAKDAQRWIDVVQEKCGSINKEVFKQFFAAGIQLGYRGGAVGLKVAEIATGGILEIGVIALRVGGAAVRVVAIAGIAVNALLIPIDIAEVIRAAVNVRQGNKTAAVKTLQEFLENIKSQKTTIKRSFDEAANPNLLQ